MINRLLEKLENPRRHLTFLVGLLALVFVLTAIVAWRANVAERDRAHIARSTLDETAAMALSDWHLLYTTYVGSTLSAFTEALTNPNVSLNTLISAIEVDKVCVDCDVEKVVTSAFIVDPTSKGLRFAGDFVDPRVGHDVMKHFDAGRFARFHEFVRGGLYFVDIDGEIVTAVVLATRDPSTSLERIAGVVISPVASRQMLDLSFGKARLLQASLAPEVRAEELFDRSALVGSQQLFAVAVSQPLHSVEVEEPVFGLTLGIAPTQSAADYLEFGADPLTDRLTIALLMLVIGALLIMAVLQVRREAELSRLRADFVSGVTHELRTPLAQIRMFTETLLLGRVRSDVERRRSLEIIDQEARRLAHLVENVLLFSKTEGGRHARVAPEPTHFAEEVRHAVESFTLLSRNREVELRMELQENITVEVDRMALRQILINLVDNALKYGPAGQRVTVGVALFDDVARLWVDDEGAGIPVEERVRVFDSFYRLKRDTESRVSGSGIGLAVVRELARLHGGDAWAEAAPVRGARIVVQFPDAYLRSDKAGSFAAAS